MPTGVVKWFNEAKGFGFVTPSDGSTDLFVHFSDISGQGFKLLVEGQRVEYDPKDGPRGPQAGNIRSLDPAPTKPARPASDRPARSPQTTTSHDRGPRTPWGAPVHDPVGFGSPGVSEPNFNDRKAPPRRFNERPNKRERSDFDDE